MLSRPICEACRKEWSKRDNIGLVNEELEYVEEWPCPLIFAYPAPHNEVKYNDKKPPKGCHRMLEHAIAEGRSGTVNVDKKSETS
jgi:hypothetical protein